MDGSDRRGGDGESLVCGKQLREMSKVNIVVFVTVKVNAHGLCGRGDRSGWFVAGVTMYKRSVPVLKKL